MSRFLVISALLGVIALVSTILIGSQGSRGRVSVLHIQPVPQKSLDLGADGDAYFNPNCPPPLHWTMSVQRCMPAWHPGEP